MSYAAIAAKNAPPEEEQPKPSQDLLEGHFEGETEASHILDDTHKVEVLDRDWKEHPETTTTTHESHPPPTNPLSESAPSPLDPANTTPHTSTSAPKPQPPAPSKDKMDSQLNAANQPPKGSEIQLPSAQEVGQKIDRATEKGKEKVEEGERKAKQEGKKAEQKGKELLDDAEKKGKEFERKAKAELKDAENALSAYYAQAKDIILRPGALGGVMGVANVGLLGTLGYYAYTRRNLPVWNRNYVGGAVASVVALFGIEGIVADQFASTPEGQYEIQRAKEEGSKVYVNAREVILRPGVAGGLLGAVNVAVLGAVGYLGYQNWDRPVWDRKLVAGITCGLISLSAVEGLAGSVYKQKELPRQKRKGNA